MQTRRLANRERFVRLVTDALPGMVGYWDADLRCRFANRAYEQWFGVQVDKLLGLRGDEHMKPDDDEVAGHRPRFAGARLKDQQGKRWQVLDLEALSRHEQFLRIVD